MRSSSYDTYIYIYIIESDLTYLVALIVASAKDFVKGS